MWLDQLKQVYGDDLQVAWKPFSLSQVNQQEGDGYRVWDEPDEKLPAAVWGLRAGIAAQRQGGEPYERFHVLLLKARHEDRKELGDKEVLRSVAQEAGLDVERFMEDLEDRSALQEIARSHEEAVEKHGVFGTPTFLFANGASAFLKMFKPATREEADSSFKTLVALIRDERFVGEVKRPQPPWPKGALAP